MTESEGTSRIWIVRSAVLVALLVTVWFAGPRAYAVVSARLGGAPHGPQVDLERVGLRSAPNWLQGPLLERVLTDLEPILRGWVEFADDAAARLIRDRLALNPWVEAVAVRRVYPDRFALDIELRRPVVAVAADERVVALVSRDGMVMPPPTRRPDLPVVTVPRAIARGYVRPGETCKDPRVLCAAHVAVEWRDEVLPHVSDAPALLEVDANNLGGRFVADPRYSEIVIALERADGAPVWMHYGRAANDGGAVQAGTKAHVLGAMLAMRPGLEGLAGGDLRLRNRWKDCLVLAE